MRRNGFVLAAVLIATGIIIMLAGSLGLAVHQGIRLTKSYGESVVRECLTQRIVEQLKYEYRFVGLPVEKEFDETYATMVLHVKVAYEREVQSEIDVYCYQVMTTGSYGSTAYVIWLPAGGTNA